MRAAIVGVSLLLSLPGSAADDDGVLVDTELFLAVDVSRSMTARELEIQRRGYAEALVSDEVVDAIAETGYGQIALTYVEWAGSAMHHTVVDWTLIRNRQDAAAFAAQLTAQEANSMRRTSISGAISHAAAAFEGNGFRGLRRVIDISGDGPNNEGRGVEGARDAALEQGIIINGLPLMTKEGMGSAWHLADLDVYYRECVIGGTGAFVLPVRSWQDFPQAVRNKLVLELSGQMPPESLPAFATRTPALQLVDYSGAKSDGSYNCYIGELIWDQIFGDWN
jgi:hypothetical protein